ncbi:MAG: helix-turn-helix transcriptional regulator [Clostridia bacterium]|nr:helix-turn-helix transcriptional regulator [Clostridia bacterium]
MSSNKDIGERLVQLRGEKTRAEVANAVGATERAIQSYETGDRVPRDEMKVRLARYYGRTVEQIFFAE